MPFVFEDFVSAAFEFVEHQRIGTSPAVWNSGEDSRPCMIMLRSHCAVAVPCHVGGDISIVDESTGAILSANCRENTRQCRRAVRGGRMWNTEAGNKSSRKFPAAISFGSRRRSGVHPCGECAFSPTAINSPLSARVVVSLQRLPDLVEEQLPLSASSGVLSCPLGGSRRNCRRWPGSSLSSSSRGGMPSS